MLSFTENKPMLPKGQENKKTGAKSMRKGIAAQITGALPGLKDELGEIEFTKRIKKASKLLSKGLKTEDQKKKAKARNPVAKIKKSASGTAAKPASKNGSAAGKKPAV